MTVSDDIYNVQECMVSVVALAQHSSMNALIHFQELHWLVITAMCSYTQLQCIG